MEAGPNDSSVIWQLVQPEISRFTRACSYDRAGFGWSDAPNEARSSVNIANELERLLSRTAVPGPYVLVGHDFGTLDLRVFAARHRQQVAGMVFVDPFILTYTISRHSTWLLIYCRERDLPRYPLDRAARSAPNTRLVSKQFHVPEPAQGMGSVGARSICSILSPAIHARSA